jgi:hypothetical protein
MITNASGTPIAYLFTDKNVIRFDLKSQHQLQRNVVFAPFSFQSVNNPYLMGQKLDNVVAKKSVPHYPEEEDYRTST